MPGTNKWRTWDKVNRTIGARKTTTRIVKERATKVLEFVQKCAKGAPDVGDSRIDIVNWPADLGLGSRWRR